MIFFGVLIVAVFLIVIGVAAKRGVRSGPLLVLALNVLIAIPAAIIGLLIWGFSIDPEGIRLGAAILIASTLIGGWVAYACIQRLRRE